GEGGGRPQGVAEGEPGEAPRKSGARVRSEGSLPAVAQPELPLHADAGVATAEDPGGSIRAKRAEVPRQPDAAERDAVRHLAAAIHRRQTVERVRRTGGGGRGQPAGCRAFAAGADPPGL